MNLPLKRSSSVSLINDSPAVGFWFIVSHLWYVCDVSETSKDVYVSIVYIYRITCTVHIPAKANEIHRHISPCSRARLWLRYVDGFTA